MNDSTVHICMICDDGYVFPTCVAISSIISAKKKEIAYVFHIIASNISLKNRKLLLSFQQANVWMDILVEDAETRFANLHQFDENAVCVASLSALLKFIIPDLFPSLNQILYLDGDLISKICLSEIYSITLEDEYAAVIMDSGSIYYKHKYVQLVNTYFNSGVMLLNLKKMREDNLSSVLVQAKKDMQDSNLMDQNVFNIVFNNRIRLLPIRYNFMPVSLDRANHKWKIEEINHSYKTKYVNKKALYDDAAIIHYSSKDKPWKDSTVALFSDWIHAYRQVSLPFELPYPTFSNDDSTTAISIIIPCYNAEKYIKQTLSSIYTQSFQNFEVICLDDGSTDNTFKLLLELQKQYKNMTVTTSHNRRQWYQRNTGIQHARGKYIYYMDSDDLLDSTALEVIHQSMEESNLDLLFFEGRSFFESKTLEEHFPHYKTYYQRKNPYPRIYNGKELYIELRKHGEFFVSPCLQVAKRTYLLEKNVFFTNMPLMEDNLYTFHATIRADRATCISDVLFFRRVRENSTMTAAKQYEQFSALSTTVSSLLREAQLHVDNSALYQTIIHHAFAFIHQLSKHYTDFEDPTFPLSSANTLLLDEVLPVFFEYEKRIARIDTLVLQRNQFENEAAAVKANNNYMEKAIDEIYASTTWKVGRFFTFFPRKIKSFFRLVKLKG